MSASSARISMHELEYSLTLLDLAERSPCILFIVLVGNQIAESERVASRLIRRGVSARSANSGRHQPRPASGRSGLRRARRASGGDGDQVCGWLNPLGSARWTRSPCALHTTCNQPAQAGGYVLPESTRRAGPDAAGEIRMQAGRRNQLGQPANRPGRLWRQL